MKRTSRLDVTLLGGWRISLTKTPRRKPTGVRAEALTDTRHACANTLAQALDVASQIGCRALSLAADSSDKWLRPETQVASSLRRLRDQLSATYQRSDSDPAGAPSTLGADHWLR